MNYCTNCGEKLHRDKKFCSNCGAQLGRPTLADELIHFSCNHCKTRYSAKPHQMGKIGTCKTCSNRIVVSNQHDNPKMVLEESEDGSAVDHVPVTDDDNYEKSEDEELFSYPRKPGVSRYTFGYIYAAFTGYLAFASFGTALGVFARDDMNLVSNDIDITIQSWTVLILSLGFSIWLAYICIRLFRRVYSLNFVYAVVGLHGLSVLMRGIVPQEVIVWFILSGYAVFYFRQTHCDEKTKT